MEGLHFKKIPGGHYKILFYIGDFFVPVEENLIEEFKKDSHRPPDEFLKMIVEKLGFNPYLRDALQEVIRQTQNPSELAKTLASELLSL